MPHWLLRSVTHFTTTEPLLDALRHMSSLTYLVFRHHTQTYVKLDVHTLGPPIPMLQLMNLIVGTFFLDEFVLLNHLLLLPVGAKRRLELEPGYRFLLSSAHWIDGLSLVVGGPPMEFQHIHFSGPQYNPGFYMWTGNMGTTW